MPYGITVLPA